MPTVSEIITKIKELNDYRSVRDYLSTTYLLAKASGKAERVFNSGLQL